MYEDKFRRNEKNKKLASKAFLYDSETVLQTECMRNLKEIGERLPVLNIRFLQFAVNDHVCIIKIILNERKKVKLKK